MSTILGVTVEHLEPLLSEDLSSRASVWHPQTTAAKIAMAEVMQGR